MFERIEINPAVCGGKPVIRGTRIPVTVLLEQLAAGKSWDYILEGYTGLTRQDLKAAVEYAVASIEHTDIVVRPKRSRRRGPRPMRQSARQSGR